MIRVEIDMNMPESCSRCPFNYDYMECMAAGDTSFEEDGDWMVERRAKWCPLVEIAEEKKEEAGTGRWDCT